MQAQVLNLLSDLRDRLHLTYIFISHDLSVSRFLCDDILVLKNGQVEEYRSADAVFSAPESPYTRSLLDAVPRLG